MTQSEAVHSGRTLDSFTYVRNHFDAYADDGYVDHSAEHRHANPAATRRSLDR